MGKKWKKLWLIKKNEKILKVDEEEVKVEKAPIPPAPKEPEKKIPAVQKTMPKTKSSREKHLADIGMPKAPEKTLKPKTHRGKKKK